MKLKKITRYIIKRYTGRYCSKLLVDEWLHCIA